MSLTMKSCFLLLTVSTLVGACTTTSTEPAQQFAAQDEQAALAMIADTLNAQCAAEGLSAGSAAHTECFWERASELREQLTIARHDELERRNHMNSADVIAERKFRGQDSYDSRIAYEQQQEKIARNDGG